LTFERLTRGDWIAWGAALVLVVSLALDWYGTEFGDDARRIEETAPTSLPEGDDLREDARLVAEGEERNPFQADGAVDRVLLVILLAAALLAFAAGALRAAGRRFEPPGTPSAAAAVAGTVGAILVAYRIVQEPGLDAATTVKSGALLGLVAAGALALGAATALRAEQDGTAWPKEEEEAAKP
jgi:hypothetical protein